VVRSGEPTRPDPESFLRAASREEKRGRLKIYLGMAAGVGKTYRMLLDAHAMRARGIDVVVGYIEPHGREETAAQIGDLEVVPRKVIEYQGVKLEEMDLQGVIARRPDIVLVDELAHTNVPGSKNQKRWQDVEEIMAAEISVMAAMNVQHLESVEDVIRSATGVEIRERVPDRVIHEADSVIDVDLPVAELQDRLRQGKVYPLEKAQQALENFFREDNLKRLRELALRQTAEYSEREITDVHRIASAPTRCDGRP
jgi:two-component system sensor histidine kinase KdpD